MLSAASPESQFYKFSLGSGFTSLRSTVGRASLYVDNSSRTEELLECLASASVEAANEKEEKEKINLNALGL